MTLEEKLQNLSDQPGVYQMMNETGDIIYVGKARNIKNRVRQYFHSESNQQPKVRAMMKHVKDFQTIITDTEVEALILECNLIKQIRPRYNILLRDDKSYPYIKITLKETFPRVIKTRNVIKDGSRYFGPYTDAGAVNETIELIRRMYPLKSCNRKIDPESGRILRPCLNYHIRKCLGPCQGNLHHQAYMDMIHQIELLLNGKGGKLQKQLHQRMQEASDSLNFEKAAMIRDQIIALDKVTEKQKMDFGREQEQDVIAAATGIEETYVQVFTVREGKIVQQHHHLMNTTGIEEPEKIISSFLKQFYDHAPLIPSEILIEDSIEDQFLIEEWLSEKKKKRVTIRIPQRGEKKKLVDLVKKNAKIQLEQRAAHRRSLEETVLQTLDELRIIAGLDQPPIRIESVDISHTAGVESVGALVVFDNGKAAKSHYRKYRIRTVSGPDDTGSIKEVLSRRIKKGLQEAKEIETGIRKADQIKDSLLPDLLLIDGGAGQVSAAEKVIDAYQLKIPVMGMVKDEKHRTRWLLYNGIRIDLKMNPTLWRFVTTIQDETHRFAISFHNQRRNRQLTQSELTEIPGIGEKRRYQLINHFDSIDQLRQATVKEISSVPGIPESVAKAVVRYFHTKGLSEGDREE